MAKKIRVKNRTADKIKELDVLVNRNGLTYNVNTNGVYAASPKGLRTYIGAKKAGGEKEMFYAASFIRNYMTKHNKKPDAAALKAIIERAGNSEATRDEWEAKYSAAQEVQEPIKKIKVVKSVTVQAPSKAPGRKKETYSTVVKKSIKKGIISTRTGAERTFKDDVSLSAQTLKSLGMDMSNQFLSEYDNKGNKYVNIRITTKPQGKKLSATVNSKNFDGDLKKMYEASDDVRRVMLRTGNIPTDKVKQQIFEAHGATLKPFRKQHTRRSPAALVKANLPRPSEMNPPSYVGDTNEVAPEKQEPKLKSKGIFTRAKIWLFGE